MNGSTHLSPLEDSELVLEEIFRHMPIGVVLSDLHGSVIDVNKAMCALLGYTRAELIGRSVRELVHPDERMDVDARIADLRHGRKGSHVATRRYLSFSGEIVNARVSASVVYTKEGEPVCSIGFVESNTEHLAMENALRQSEARYRRVVEDQTELIVRCLADGTRTFVNEAYCRYNEATRDELLGTSFFGRIPVSEQQAVRDKFAALNPARPVTVDEHWVIAPDGTLRWHEWTDRGFFDDAGRLVEIQSVGRDLTEEHEAREGVVRSEERYRRLFNGLPIAAWENDLSDVIDELRRRHMGTEETMTAALREQPALFYEVGGKSKIVGVNPAALAMAGVSNLDEFWTWLKTAWAPESAQRYALALAPIFFGESKGLTDEFTLIRADGRPVDVLFHVARSERWGKEWMLFPMAVDVTDRKRAQSELVHRQELTDRAEAAAHIGSWEWNSANNSIFGSTEFWRIVDGREAQKPQERSVRECLDLMFADDAANSERLWKLLQAPSTESRPSVIDSDYRLVRADGATAVVKGQSFLSFGADGAMTRAFGVLRDITEAKRAEQEATQQRDELVRADKMITLGILVSGMAHEISNPNQSIMLNLPLIRDAWRDGVALVDELAAQCPDQCADLRVGRMPWSEARTEVAAMLADVDHASERIRAIVTELRGFALEHDPGIQGEVSVNAIAQSSLRLLGKHIDKATRDFGIELGDDVPPVTGNARRLEQVVVNLIINACQALETPEQSVRVLTGIDGQRVFIRVRDGGRGIAAEHMSKIRDPFFTTRRAEGGTGLGLAVSDRIAGEHGGALTFESEIGRGTTATLWLPMRGS